MAKKLKPKDRKKLETDLEMLIDQVKNLEGLIEKSQKEGRVNWSLYRELETVEDRIGRIKAQLKKSE